MPFDLADIVGFIALTGALTLCVVIGNRFLAVVEKWVEESVKPAVAARLDEWAERKS